MKSSTPLLAVLLSWALNSASIPPAMGDGDTATHNPLIEPGRASPHQNDGSIVQCFLLELELSVVGQVSQSGVLHATNDCAYAVAVLLAPVEVRRCGAQGTKCFYEGPLLEENVYGRLYVYSLNEGFPSELRGQYRLTVKSPPGFGVVAPGARVEWPVSGVGEMLRGLKPGKYGAYFETVGVAVEETSSTVTTLDLSQTVKAHNEAAGIAAAPVVLNPGAQTLPCGVATFTIGTEKPWPTRSACS